LLLRVLLRVAKANLVVWLCDDCSGCVWLFDHNGVDMSVRRSHLMVTMVIVGEVRQQEEEV